MIRRYQPRDTEDVLRVWRAATQLAHPFLDEAFLDDEEKAIRHEHLPAAATWVWDDDGQVVGFMSMVGSEIGGLFVDPRQQRRGIGAAFVDLALTRHGVVDVEVFSRNAIGRAFYSKRGFEPIGEGFDERAGEAVLRLRLDGPRSDSDP